MGFKRILLPLDGSQLAEEVLPHAVRIARAFGASMLLLHVMRAQPQSAELGVDSVDWRLHRLERTDYLRELVRRLMLEGVEAEFHVTEGRPAEQIAEFAAEQGIDLVAVSAYGHGGITRFPLGSTVQKLLSLPSTSYLVVRPSGKSTHSVMDAPPYRRILVPLDGSQRAEWTVSLAKVIAHSEGADLVLLQVITTPEMLRHLPASPEEQSLKSRIVHVNRTVAENYLTELGHRYENGTRVLTRVVVGDRVASAIQHVAESESIDLIALCASSGCDSLDLDSGAVCRSMVAFSPWPMLIFQDRPNVTFQDVVEGIADVGERLVYGS